MMNQDNKIQLFQEQGIRSHWDDEQDQWYFSVVDVVAVLTESPRPRKYWSALKTKLKEEGSQLSHTLGQLKLESANANKYKLNTIGVYKAD